MALQLKTARKKYWRMMDTALHPVVPGEAVEPVMKTRYIPMSATHRFMRTFGGIEVRSIGNRLNVRRVRSTPPREILKPMYVIYERMIPWMPGKEKWRIFVI